MLRAVLIVFLFATGPVVKAQHAVSENPLVRSGAEEVLWMQKVLDNWTYTCLNELNIEAKVLPWIIFYDSAAAWHVNADESVLPPFERTDHHVTFAGKDYQLIRMAHEKNVWVPDMEPFRSLLYRQALCRMPQIKKLTLLPHCHRCSTS